MHHRTPVRLGLYLVLGLAASLCGAGRSVSAQAAPPTKILFASNRDGNGKLNIYVMNTDGSGQTNLTKDDAFEFDPASSPDGKQIAYAAFADPKDTKAQIYLMNADGTQRKPITKQDRIAFSPLWSPDGKRIAFSAMEGGVMTAEGPKIRMQVMDADGGNVKDLGDGIVSAWSSDGKKLLFSKFEKTEPVLYLWDLGGGKSAPVGSIKALMAVWSPDGKRIACVAEGDNHQPGLFIMNADGSGKTPLSSGDAMDFGPQWSTDGKLILFTRFPKDAGPMPQAIKTSIYAVDADGKNPRALTKGDSMDVLGGSGFFLAFVHMALQAAAAPPQKETK